MKKHIIKPLEDMDDRDLILTYVVQDDVGYNIYPKDALQREMAERYLEYYKAYGELKKTEQADTSDEDDQQQYRLQA